MWNFTLHIYSRHQMQILGSLCFQIKVITCLHWNEVISWCLKFKYQKPNPRGFRIVLHITETSTGARLVMNYAGFQSQFDLFVDGLHFKQFGLMLFSNLTATEICSLYCLLLIITWQLNGSECGTGKSSLSIQYPSAVNSFQKRLFTVVTIVTKEQSRFVVLNHQFCLVLFKQWI